MGVEENRKKRLTNRRVKRNFIYIIFTFAIIPFSAKAKLAVKSNSPISIVKIYHGKKILTNLFFIKFLNFSKQI